MSWLARLFGRMPRLAAGPDTILDSTVETRLSRLAQGADLPRLPCVGVFRRSR
jgi:hypothetical protein